MSEPEAIQYLKMLYERVDTEEDSIEPDYYYGLKMKIKKNIKRLEKKYGIKEKP